MPTTVNVDSNYVGEAANEIFVQIFKQANTIADGLITVIPNVSSSLFLQKTYVTPNVVDYTCGFSPSGLVDLTEVELTPKKLKSELEICKETFRSRWSQAKMGFSSWNDQIPANEQEALILDLSNGMAARIDANIWVGTGSTNGFFTGLINQFQADADVVKVTGVTITAANVIDEMGKALDAVSDAVISRDDFIFGISNNVYRAYVRSLNAVNTNWNDTDAFYDSYKLSVINGLPANTMVLYPKSNVFIGAGLTSDFTEIRIKDMDDSDLSGNIRVKMVFNAGTAYIDGSDIVLYSI